MHLTFAVVAVWAVVWAVAEAVEGLEVEVVLAGAMAAEVTVEAVEGTEAEVVLAGAMAAAAATVAAVTVVAVMVVVATAAGEMAVEAMAVEATVAGVAVVAILRELTRNWMPLSTTSREILLASFSTWPMTSIPAMSSTNDSISRLSMKSSLLLTIYADKCRNSTEMFDPRSVPSCSFLRPHPSNLVLDWNYLDGDGKHEDVRS